MTLDLAEKALTAKRESKTVEFKQGFDCEVKGEWCEVIKDLVAMANSGGGIVVFGLGNTGEPMGADLTKVAELDPADIANKIGSYIGSCEIDLQVLDLVKDSQNLVAFVVGAATIPLVFEKQGNYADSAGKQKSAFGIGTIYFRHGAKSEPANNGDLRRILAQQIDSIRKEWIEGVRKVVEAPAGTQIVVASMGASAAGTSDRVHLSKDPSAAAVRLTRATEGTTGTLVHEEISEALLNEINNVIDMNRLLFTTQDSFLLGPQIYYRIYAERQYVAQASAQIAQLFHFGIAEYCPLLFWCSLLSDEIIAEQLSEIFIRPKGNEVQTLLRFTPLLGKGFCDWLVAKFIEKWSTYSQPPAFYWRVKNCNPGLGMDDSRLLASRLSQQAQANIAGTLHEPVAKILNNHLALHGIVSKACMEVFNGDKNYKAVARDYDYLAHGQDIMSRSKEIFGLVREIVGDKLPADEEAIAL
jgi:Putative DNA-binding domain